MDSLRVWDLRRALQEIRSATSSDVRIVCHPVSRLELLAVCAVLFEPSVQRLHLSNHTMSVADQPAIVNLARFFTDQELVALAGWRTCLVADSGKDSAGLFRKLAASPEWRGFSPGPP